MLVKKIFTKNRSDVHYFLTDGGGGGGGELTLLMNSGSLDFRDLKFCGLLEIP